MRLPAAPYEEAIALVPRYHPISDLPIVKSTDVTAAPKRTSRQDSARSGRILKIAPKSRATRTNETIVFSIESTNPPNGSLEVMTSPKAEIAALAANETRSKKPKDATNPRLAIRVRARLKSDVFCSWTFQMRLSVDCISPNTPDAPTSNVITAMIEAKVPLFADALSTVAFRRSAPCGPSKPVSWADIASSAASRPVAIPAMASTIRRIGDKEVAA